MPAPEKHYFVELGRHTLTVARVGGTTLEAIRECGTDNRIALEEALTAINPDWQAEGLRAAVSLAPSPTGWHLGNAEESRRTRTESALRGFLSTLNHGLAGELEMTGCSAEDGAMIQPAGNARWLLAFAPKDAFETQATHLAEWKIEADRIESAGLCRVGAIVTALQANDTGPVALWDLGAQHSQLLLVTKQGVEGVAACAITLDEVFAATQAALGLKFKGAAARLFFNDTYDFSQVSAKVAATIAPGLKNALTVLPQLDKPPALACLGLTGRQGWFVRAAAAAVKLASWTEDPHRLAGQWQVGIDPQLPEASLSLASLGLLHLISAYVRRSPAWHPTWKMIGNATAAPMRATVATPVPFAEAPAAPATRPPVPVEVRPEPRAKPTLAPDPAAAPALPPVPPPAPPPAVPVVAPAPIPAPLAAVPAPAPKPVAKPPAVPITPTAAPLPSPPAVVPASAPVPGLAVPKALPGVPPPRPVNPTHSPFPQHTSVPKPEGGPALRPRAQPDPAKGAEPPAPLPTLRPNAPAAPRRSLPKVKNQLYVGIAVAAFVVIAVVFALLYAKASREKAEALQREQATAAARVEAETRAAEQLAQAQAEAIETKRRNDVALEAAVAAARQQAAGQERQRLLAQLEQERLEKLPGILVIGTTPSGAAVSVDGQLAQRAPLTARDLPAGSHILHIELENYEPLDLKVTVKGGKTTDLGALPLTSVAGSIEVKSNPPGLTFAVHKADDEEGTPLATGTTPTTVPAILPGDYLVTYTRQGWADHLERVTVRKRTKQLALAGYDPITVEITSTPAGATVKQSGHVLGSTPITLTDVLPEDSLSYDLTLPGYDALQLAHPVITGPTLKLQAEMLSADRVAKQSEVKQAPHAYETPDPEITPEQRLRGAEVIITVVVLKNGSTKDIEIEKTTDRWIGERCLDAVRQWRFNPGMGFNDQPLNVKVHIPFTIGRRSGA